MKLSEYLVFAALLTPTLVVIAAAVLSLTTSDSVPGYQAPIIVTASGGGHNPADKLTTDE